MKKIFNKLFCKNEEKLLINQNIITREYAMRHNINDLSLVPQNEVDIKNFSLADLQLSLNDFSRKQGWME